MQLDAARSLASLLHMLNPASLRLKLTTDFCGRHLLQFASLDSTNRLLADWSKRNPGGSVNRDRWPEGLTAIATRQTAGRGTRGHEWVSAAGGLYLSVLLYPNVAVGRLLELTLAIAWGVALSLRRELAIDVQLKWPNDLLVGGRKLGGVLLGARSHGSHAQAAIAGLGLNGYNPVPDVGISLADCRQASGSTDSDCDEISLEQVAAICLAGIEMGYRQWRAAGLAGLQPAYESLMAYRNDRVNCDRDRTGRIVGIDASGRLQVAVNGAIDTFAPGQIQLGYGVPLGVDAEQSIEPDR